jgi:hypothetical protein
MVTRMVKIVWALLDNPSVSEERVKVSAKVMTADDAVSVVLCRGVSHS